MDIEKEGTRRKIGTELQGNLGSRVVIHLFSILSLWKDLVEISKALKWLRSVRSIDSAFQAQKWVQSTNPSVFVRLSNLGALENTILFWRFIEKINTNNRN